MNNEMISLFSRLKALGYDHDFLRRAVLPDWWEDSMAANPVSFEQIRLHLAQQLGVPLMDLVEAAGPVENNDPK